MAKTDEELAKGVQEGNSNAFDLLVERYEPKIRRYARKFLSCEQDAEDAMQEIFIKAYTNIRSFDSGKRFSPWIYRIAHNEFVNFLRKRKENFFHFFDPDTLFPHPVAKEKADELLKNKETKELVDGYLGKIPEKYREPLVLYYLEELDYSEIADVLRIPVSTVGVRLKRGKEQLKKITQNGKR